MTDTYKAFQRMRRDPKRLRQMRPMLLKRANYACQICDLLLPEILILHHIVPMKYFVFPMDQGAASNLIAICPNCHAVTHHVSRYGTIEGHVVRSMDWPANRDLIARVYGIKSESAERLLIVATEWAEFSDGTIRLLPRENNRYSPHVPHQSATVDAHAVVI